MCVYLLFRCVLTLVNTQIEATSFTISFRVTVLAYMFLLSVLLYVYVFNPKHPCRR